jgi:hypothetical protein
VGGQHSLGLRCTHLTFIDTESGQGLSEGGLAQGGDDCLQAVWMILPVVVVVVSTVLEREGLDLEGEGGGEGVGGPC